MNLNKKQVMAYIKKSVPPNLTVERYLLAIYNRCY